MGSLPVSPSAHTDPAEFIFLGTGPSSTLPHVDCLTAPPEATPCHTCLSTLRPEGKKNIRRNTSAVMRVRGKDGDLVTIVIDVGKSFQASAIEWFPKYGLRRIDAVLITHAHADAMNGLDDLRGWTLRGAIQPHVDIYVSQATFGEVQRSFPYLISKEFASGGGDVPEFKWHIIDDRVPFEIEGTGVHVTPFNVHHGRVFSTLPPPEFTFRTPSSSLSPTPDPPGTPMEVGSPPRDLNIPQPIQPYLCFGFVIQDCVTYISDVSHIPDDVWAFLKSGRIPPVFVLDCLRLQPHTSHLGIAQAVTIAREMGAQRTYLIGFSHEVSHDEYITLCEAVEGKTKALPQKKLSPVEEEGMKLIPTGKSAWIRPAFDGLRVLISGDGEVRDKGYDDV